jgi:hypothetical protein
MVFPKPVLDPKSIEPTPKYSHFSGARPANSKIVIWRDLRQKSINISALAQWILDQVPVLETSLDSTPTLPRPNDDRMSNSWSKKPPKSREGENEQKDWLKIEIEGSIHLPLSAGKITLTTTFYEHPYL